MSSLKRLAALTAVALVCLAAGPALAEVKLGVVDIQRALNESEAGKKAKAQLSQRVEKMQGDLKVKKEQLEKMEADLQKQAAVLTGEAKRDKDKEFDRRKRDYSDLVRDYQEELSQAELTATQPILKEMEGLIEKLGREQGYTVILESKMGGVIFSAQGIDLTEAVIKAHNEMKKK
jgi:outer membrane protein